MVLYISFRFEPKMALAAFLAMVHDLLVTVGIYAIFGFQVTPDTVVAVLTILGYSLYDTVVVFDRVRDNTKPFAASGRMTYSAMVNLSMNQTLARSINTSLVAILPVLSVLLVGAELLGAVDAAELRRRADRRAALGCVLLDLHRGAASGDAEGARAQVHRRAQPTDRQGTEGGGDDAAPQEAARMSLSAPAGEHRRVEPRAPVATATRTVSTSTLAGSAQSPGTGDRSEAPQAEEALNPVGSMA